jgi:hypothetical protein
MGAARGEDFSQWRKSSYSSDTANCVEFRITLGSDAESLVGVRDSKDADGPQLSYSPQAWQAFVERIREGWGS